MGHSSLLSRWLSNIQLYKSKVLLWIGWSWTFWVNFHLLTPVCNNISFHQILQKSNFIYHSTFFWKMHKFWTELKLFELDQAWYFNSKFWPLVHVWKYLLKSINIWPSPKLFYFPICPQIPNKGNNTNPKLESHMMQIIM